MNAIREATRTVKVGETGDTVELFNIDTARLMRSLAMRFSLYIDTRAASLAGQEQTAPSEWSWYEQIVKASLELQETAVDHRTALRQHLELLTRLAGKSSKAYTGTRP